MARYKIFKYTVDTKEKSVDVEFTGDWSRGDLDRMHKTAMRQLSQHKLSMRRNDERERTKSSKSSKRAK